MQCKIGGKHTLKGVGKNPRLAHSKSKNDKNISGLLNQIIDNKEAGKIGIHTFTNASSFTVGESDVKTISIEFAPNEAVMAQFFGSVIVGVNADQVERSVVARGDVLIPSVEVEEVLAEGTAGNEETTNSGTTDSDAMGTDVVDETGGSSDSAVVAEEPKVIGNTKEQTLSVELPVVWKEDGQVVVYFTFEFNDNIIEIHQPEETWRSGKHSIMENSKAAFYQIMETRLETQTVEELAELFGAVEVDFENNILINFRFQDSSVIIHKRRLSVFTLELNDTTNDLLEEKVISCSTFKFLGSYTPYGDFLDGHDGYWYGFSNQVNSSGDAKMYWVKIKKDDYTMTEGIWTLSNCYLKAIGYFKVDTYAQRGVRGVIRNGYLYLTAYDDAGIYKINLSNSTDVTLIPFGFTSAGKSQTGSGTCANYLFMVNDLIIGWDYQIKPDDTVVQTVGSTRLLNLGTPLFQYKEFCFGWGGNYGSDYRMCFLLTPHLASINNLSTAVVKTTDKTMKITYELTEVDS